MGVPRIVKRLRVVRVPLTLVVLIVVGGVAAQAVFAQAGGVVRGCVGGDRVLSLAPAGGQCPAGKRAISWSERGPAGPAGPRGATGATGPAGPRGPAGFAGVDIRVAEHGMVANDVTGRILDAPCTAAERVVGGGYDNGTNSILITRSRPVQGLPDKWEVVAKNPGGPATSVFVYAVCVDA